MVLLLLVEEDSVQLIYSPQSTTIHQIFSCPFRVQLQIDYASLVACRVVYCGELYCTGRVVIVVVVDFILSPDTEFANLIILFIRRADEGQDWAKGRATNNNNRITTSVVPHSNRIHSGVQQQYNVHSNCKRNSLNYVQLSPSRGGGIVVGPDG